MILTKIMTERFLTDFWASKMRNDENVVPLFVDKILEQITASPQKSQENLRKNQLNIKD